MSVESGFFPTNAAAHISRSRMEGEWFELALCYGVGMIGAILSREAFRCGSKAYNYSFKPLAIQHILVMAIFAILGPITWIAAAVWWVCAFVEHYPLWNWRW